MKKILVLLVLMVGIMLGLYANEWGFVPALDEWGDEVEELPSYTFDGTYSNMANLNAKMTGNLTVQNGAFACKFLKGGYDTYNPIGWFISSDDVMPTYDVFMIDEEGNTYKGSAVFDYRPQVVAMSMDTTSHLVELMESNDVIKIKIKEVDGDDEFNFKINVDKEYIGHINDAIDEYINGEYITALDDCIVIGENPITIVDAIRNLTEEDLNELVKILEGLGFTRNPQNALQ